MTAILEKLSPWLFTLGLFAIWEAACRVFNVNQFVLPAPSVIFLAMAEYWQPLLRHSAVTLWTTMAGIGLAVIFGIVLGLAALGNGIYFIWPSSFAAPLPLDDKRLRASRPPAA